MFNMTTQESKKLIDIFMGVQSDDPFGATSYHLIWDELMPVVEKIEHVGLVKVSITEKNCYIDTTGVENEDPAYMKRLNKFKGINLDDETKIEATYRAVIQFIQWFNQKTIEK
jgi:hypothetical protein